MHTPFILTHTNTHTSTTNIYSKLNLKKELTALAHLVLEKQSTMCKKIPQIMNQNNFSF